LEHSEGFLTNPSGDGRNLQWGFGDRYAEKFNITAQYTKYGTVKGFWADPSNPYADIGLKYLEWDRIDSEFEISALGLKFRG